MKVLVYGSHVKTGYVVDVSCLSDLDVHGMLKKKQGIKGLVDSMCKPSSRRKFTQHHGDILDDVHMKRPLNTYAEYRIGKADEDVFGFDRANRLLLMNDEVVWQWKTGSVLCYRFICDSKAAELFYRWCLDGKTDDGQVHVTREETPFKFKIGDEVEMLEDVDILPNAVGMFANFSGYFGYKKGEKVRVYSVDDKSFIASGEDGKTLIRIPRTGGAKEWIGSGPIPVEKAELVKPLA